MSAAPSLARTLNTIHSFRNVDPHARLWAAVLASAVADARKGDPEARLWLERCALGYLWSLVPDDEVDCEGLLSTLLAELPAPSSRKSRAYAGRAEA
jgi:hypothetical protein